MVGKKLEELLLIRNIKAGTLATMTGIPKSTIYSIIKRNNKNVDFSVMEKISDVLDVPVEFFYDKTSDKQKESAENGGLDEEEQELIKAFRGFNRDGQLALLNTARGWLAAGLYIKRDVSGLEKDA